MKNTSRSAKVTKLPSRARRGVSDAEWQARVEFAAAYRLTAMMGWTDMLGTHTVGATISEMFARMYRLERACKFQITAMAGGAELNRLPQGIVEHTLEQGKKIYAQGGRGEGGKLMWAAQVRKLDLVDPGYAA